MEMEKNVNVKMLELTIENKEMKRKNMEELTTQQKEWQDLRKKEEVWNVIKQ